MHQHTLVKGLSEDADLDALWLAGKRRWERLTGAWRVELRELRTARGATAYIVGHHHKGEQAPPRGWKGRRFRSSRGYFSRPVPELREEVKDRMQFVAARKAIERVGGGSVWIARAVPPSRMRCRCLHGSNSHLDSRTLVHGLAVRPVPQGRPEQHQNLVARSHTATTAPGPSGPHNVWHSQRRVPRKSLAIRAVKLAAALGSRVFADVGEVSYTTATVPVSSYGSTWKQGRMAWFRTPVPATS